LMTKIDAPELMTNIDAPELMTNIDAGASMYWERGDALDYSCLRPQYSQLNKTATSRRRR
jgi:hypothetical protein